MQNPIPTRRIVLANFVGLTAVGVQLIIVFLWLVHDDERGILGILAYAILVVAALSAWHGKAGGEKAGDLKTSAVLAGGSIVAGGLSFCVDMLIGSLSNPGMSLVEAGTKAGSPFGFMLTILLCPGLTMVGVAGVVRALIIRNHSETGP